MNHELEMAIRYEALEDMLKEAEVTAEELAE